MALLTSYFSYITSSIRSANKIKKCKFIFLNPSRLIPSTILKTYIFKPSTTGSLIRKTISELMRSKCFFIFFISLTLIALVAYYFCRLKSLFLKIYKKINTKQHQIVPPTSLEKIPPQVVPPPPLEKIPPQIILSPPLEEMFNHNRSMIIETEDNSSSEEDNDEEDTDLTKKVTAYFSRRSYTKPKKQ